jgi:predicted HNH restriction endonuclease
MAKTRLFLTDSLNKAIDKVTAQMTPAVRLAAINEGWDRNAANGILVEHKPDTIKGTAKVAKFTATLDEAAGKEEYGTQESSPRGTVRKFMHNNRPWEKTMAKTWERETFKGGRK